MEEELNPKQSSNRNKDADQPHRKYHDSVFSAFFFAQVAVVIIFAFLYGLRALSYEGAKSVLVGADNSFTKLNSYSHTSTHFLGGIFLTLLFSGILSMAWVYALSRISHSIISFTFGLIFFATSMSGIILVVNNNGSLGWTFLAASLAVVILFWYLRPRIQFAAASLRVACTAINELPSLVVCGMGMMAVSIWFVVLWSMAVVGVATNEANSSITASGVEYSLNKCATYEYSTMLTIGTTQLTCTSAKTCLACVCGSSTFVSASRCFSPRINWEWYFILLVSLLWTCNVCSNIVHCTCASAVSAWLTIKPSELLHQSKLHPHNSSHNPHRRTAATTWMDAGPHLVQTSFGQSVTTSLGSICLGSLLVALISAARATVFFNIKMLSKSRKNNSLTTFLLKCLHVMLQWLDEVVKYFNKYAFCFVAIYGYSFFESSKNAVTLFEERGLTAVVNDDIVDVVLSLGHFFVAVLSSLFSFLYGSMAGLCTVDRTLLCSVGFLGGYLLCAVILKVISSAVATTYVCYAESRSEMKTNQRELFEDLDSAWQRIHPLRSGSKGQSQSQSQSHGDAPARTQYQPPRFMDSKGSYASVPSSEAQSKAVGAAGGDVELGEGLVEEKSGGRVARPDDAEGEGEGEGEGTGEEDGLDLPARWIEADEELEDDSNFLSMSVGSLSESFKGQVDTDKLLQSFTSSTGRIVDSAARLLTTSFYNSGSGSAGSRDSRGYSQDDAIDDEGYRKDSAVSKSKLAESMSRSQLLSDSGVLSSSFSSDTSHTSYTSV